MAVTYMSKKNKGKSGSTRNTNSLPKKLYSPAPKENTFQGSTYIEPTTSKGKVVSYDSKTGKTTTSSNSTYKPAVYGASMVGGTPDQKEVFEKQVKSSAPRLVRTASGNLVKVQGDVRMGGAVPSMSDSLIGDRVKSSLRDSGLEYFEPESEREALTQAEGLRSMQALERAQQRDEQTKETQIEGVKDVRDVDIEAQEIARGNLDRVYEEGLSLAKDTQKQNRIRALRAIASSNIAGGSTALSMQMQVDETFNEAIRNLTADRAYNESLVANAINKINAIANTEINVIEDSMLTEVEKLDAINQVRNETIDKVMTLREAAEAKDETKAKEKLDNLVAGFEFIVGQTPKGQMVDVPIEIQEAMGLPAQVSGGEALPTKSYQYDEDSGTVFDPSTGEVTDTTQKKVGDEVTVGNIGGVITSFGTDANPYGVDIQFAGGKDAKLPAFVGGTVIAAGEAGNWGNSVVIETPEGQKLRISHLDNIDVAVGDEVDQDTFIGNQGNSGYVIPSAGGTGIHADITLYNQDDIKQSAEQALQFISGSSTGGLHESITTQDKLDAVKAAGEMKGSRAKSSIEERRDLILERLSEVRSVNPDVTIEDITDELRLRGMGISDEAIQDSLTNLGLSGTDFERTLEAVGDSLSTGEVDKAKETIRLKALQSVSAEEAKQERGNRRVVAALEDIDEIINEFSDKGGDLNLITGGVEKLEQNILKTTGNKELARIGARIKPVMLRFRKDITGVAFSPQEQADIASLFPDISKTIEYNQVIMDSLRESIKLNSDMFLIDTIGQQNFDELFGGVEESQPTNLSQEENDILAEFGL